MIFHNECSEYFKINLESKEMLDQQTKSRNPVGLEH